MSFLEAATTFRHYTSTEKVGYMSSEVLHSVLFELQAHHDALIARAMGHQVHAMFLNLIKQFDPALSARLHNEPGYRPFTLSLLQGGECQREHVVLRKGQTYQMRVTLLDGDFLWDGLKTHFLEAGAIIVSLGAATLHLTKIRSTMTPDTTGWVRRTDWKTLMTSFPPHRLLAFHFTSPTAFSFGDRTFELFPKPLLVWESLRRTWNRYAPADFQIEKDQLQTWVSQSLVLKACDLHVENLRFHTHIQKGFLGMCQYELVGHDEFTRYLLALAAFAYYAGIGSKTTMGMGQVHVAFSHPLSWSSCSDTLMFRNKQLANTSVSSIYPTA